MSDKLFDEFIRQKVNDHSANVPADMWNRIQSGNTKRRGIAWWKNPVGVLLIGAMLVAGGWAIYASLENEPTSKIMVDEKEANATTRLIDENKITGNEKDLNVGSNNSNQVLVDNNEKALVNNKGEHSNAKNSTSNSTSNAARQNTIQQSDIPSITDKNNSQKSKRHTSILNTSSPKLQVQNGDDVGQDYNMLRLQDFNREMRNSLSLIAASQKNISQKKLNEKLLKDQKFYGFTECPSAYGNARNDWYLEAYASPDYAFKSTTKGNLPDSYFAKKDSTESFTSAFTAGVRISKNIGENLMIKSGLQYSQINEKFSLRTENERRLITVVTIRTIIRSPGDTLIVSDTSMVEQIGYRVKTTHNKYRSLDVPIILGYEWGNEKWKASVNAGVILNLRSWQEGEMLDTSYTAVSFSKSSAQTFKQNLGLGLYAGFSIIKPVTPQVEIFAEPYFRYNISNMTQSKSLFNQRFHSAGINLGIRYKLNNLRQRY